MNDEREQESEASGQNNKAETVFSFYSGLCFSVHPSSFRIHPLFPSLWL